MTIKEQFSKINNNKSKIIILIILAVIISLLANSVFFGEKKIVESVKVVRGDIYEVVEVAGQVEASKNADISFEKSGIISTINVTVGQNVKAGDVLAVISAPETFAAVKESQAAVEVARANLESVKSGYTTEEINVKRQALENSKKDAENAALLVDDTIRNTQTTLNDIFDFRLSTIFYNETTQYRLAFSVCDQASGSLVESQRRSFTSFNIKDLNSAKDNLDSVSNFINKIYLLLSLPCSSADSSLADERATITGIKASIQALYSDISSKKTSLQNSQNAVLNAERALDLVLAGGDQNKINSSRAQLLQAEARLESSYAQASKNTLKAPFSGIISVINIEKGELVSQSKPAISIISDSQYQIKAKIAEVDVAKMSLNSKATVTIDAYPGETFYATVTVIDPASTDEGGVPRYGVTLTFVENYPKLRIGMTANADIETQKRSNVLIVPSAYVEVRSGKGVLKIKTKDNTDGIEKDVQIGIRSQDGKVEITGGVNEGDELMQMSEDGSVVR